MFILIRLGRPSERVGGNGSKAGVYVFKTPTSCWKIKVPKLTTGCLFGFSKKQINKPKPLLRLTSLFAPSSDSSVYQNQWYQIQVPGFE